MRTRHIRSLAIVTAAVTVLVASTVSARALGIPAMVPDICFGSCVQFTQTSALASIQQLQNQIQMLQNMTTQLAQMRIDAHTMAGLWPQMKSDFDAIKTAYTDAASGTQAAAAADVYMHQEVSDEAFLDDLKNETDAAQGSTQQTQLTNRYLATLDGDVRKNGALFAAQVHEKTDEKIGDTANIFGLLNSSATSTFHSIRL
jgi:conjugal transfer/entry exclusion protein